MFVKTTNGHVDEFPYTIGQLRRDNPNTSFPKSVPNGLLAEYGVYPVSFAPKPEVDEATHTAVKADAPDFTENHWVLNWVVSEKSAEKQAEYRAETEERVRYTRNERLSKSDWVVIYHTEKGTNIPMEWEVYRQALRDITDQAGFPYDVTWPEKPSS